MSLNCHSFTKGRYLVTNLFLALVFGLSVLCPSAQAQFKVAASPMENFQTPARAGARITNEINVFNGSDQDLYFSASLSDWTADKTGTQQFVEANTTPQSCAQWIQLNPQEFQLRAGQSTRVRYSVTPPGDLKNERRAMIFFESRPIPVKGEGNIVNMVSLRLGCKVFILPTKASPDGAHISSLQLGPNGTLQVTIENAGIRSFRLKSTKVSLFDKTNKLVAEGNLLPDVAMILSGNTREFSVKWDKTILPGTYRIQTVVDYGGLKLAGAETTLTLDKALEIAQSTPVISAGQQPLSSEVASPPDANTPSEEKTLR